MINKRKRLLSIVLSCTILLSGGVFFSNTDVAEAATDATFSSEMKVAGFPDSYITGLAQLHKQYPQWQFEAVDTGLDWGTVITKESVNGVNLVPKSGDDARKSTAAGAYDWNTNTWTIYDGSNWVAANSGYIAYYMDPRNFLNETDIFQFESLSFNKLQTKSGVNAILSGTFMAKTVTDSDETTLNYANAFMKIGELTGVSPYHLASRVRQEQGLNGTSSLISGTYKGYEGYFNYFNVGAAGVTSTLVIKNGLAYAKKAGWDTRYKALLGGSQLLAKNYIAVGQDTLYFQKFNVVNKKNLYGHQYMSNLTAAYTEGRKLGQGYTDKQQAFVFRIPVYKSMPSSAVTFTATGNPNNYLKNITVAGQSLTPGFKSDTTKYSLVVENTVSSISVNATAVAATSSITGTGTKKLNVGTNTINVKCKSASGSTRTYKLTVVRKEAAKPTGTLSSTKYTVGDKYITGITQGTKASNFLAELSVDGGTAKLVGANGKQNQGLAATGNKVEVYVDNKKKTSYEVVIYGDVNGDGEINVLDMIKVNRHILGLDKLSGVYLVAADANRKGDGLNVLDMIYINRHALGLSTIKQ